MFFSPSQSTRPLHHGAHVAAAASISREARAQRRGLRVSRTGAGMRVRAEAAPLHIRTPLILSNPMSDILGKPVYLKMDALQPSAKDLGAKSLVSSSGGNAGLAVAHSGRALDLPTTVVVPETTPAYVCHRLRAYGAEVIVHGSEWRYANERAIEEAQQADGVLVHPFEGENTWEGHGSLVHELHEDMVAPPGVIVASVGGGGLVLGILDGLQHVGWEEKVAVVACETSGADSFASSMAAGELVTLPAITSLAKSLGANRVSEFSMSLTEAGQGGQTLFEKAIKGPTTVTPWVCSDADAVHACIRFANDHRWCQGSRVLATSARQRKTGYLHAVLEVLVEPACGAALAAVYSYNNKAPGVLDNFPSVVVEVCGGSIVDLPSLNAWAAELGVAQ